MARFSYNPRNLLRKCFSPCVWQYQKCRSLFSFFCFLFQQPQKLPVKRRFLGKQPYFELRVAHFTNLTPQNSTQSPFGISSHFCWKVLLSQCHFPVFLSTSHPTGWFLQNFHSINADFLRRSFSRFAPAKPNTPLFSTPMSTSQYAV